MRARRPPNPPGALAICSLAAGLLGFLLVLTGWQTPTAMLVGFLSGTCAYLAFRLLPGAPRR